MPRVPRRVGDPDELCQLAVRVPGWFKNEVVDAAEGEGVSVQVWVVGMLRRCLDEGYGLPLVGEGGRLPDVVDVVRGYVLGERVVLPCGRVGSCAGVGAGVLPGGLRFCGECGVRVG